jgi:hypothetical protein
LLGLGNTGCCCCCRCPHPSPPHCASARCVPLSPPPSSGMTKAPCDWRRYVLVCPRALKSLWSLPLKLFEGPLPFVSCNGSCCPVFTRLSLVACVMLPVWAVTPIMHGNPWQINPTCTYHRSGKSFITQKYYRCITCDFTADKNKGVCEPCVKSCHAGHSVTGPNEGGFYCDCGSEGKCCSLYTAPAPPKDLARDTQVSPPLPSIPPLLCSHLPFCCTVLCVSTPSW